MKKRTKKERLATLRKRHEYLSARIHSSEVDLSYDKAERDALAWALPILEQYVALAAFNEINKARAKETQDCPERIDINDGITKDLTKG